MYNLLSILQAWYEFYALHPIMTFSIAIAMTMHYRSGTSRYARKCQKRLTIFKRRLILLVIWLMPSGGYKLIKLLFSLKWNFVFPLLYFFGAFLPKQTWEANEECFQAIGLAKNPGRSPFSLLGCAQISEVKILSNPSLVNEVRTTRSKSQF